MSDSSTPPPSSVQRALGSPASWVSTTYFAEGFPYSVVHNVANLLFTQAGASLQAIGLLSLLHLPWNLKFLVGPYVDEYATKRRWLVGVELAIVASLAALAVAAQLPTVLILSGVLFAMLAIVSATHDIAIDGLYLEALDKDQQAKLVGLRAPAYRFATYIVGGPLITLCGKTSFSVGLAVAAAIMAALFAFHAMFLPRSEVAKKPLAQLPRALLRPAVLMVLGAIAALVGALFALLSLIEGVAPAVAKKVGIAGLIGVTLLAGVIVLMLLLPRIRARAAQSSSFYGRAFVSFLDQPYVGRILAFVLLFRVGESFLMTMKTPFCTRALGLTTEEYGLVNGWIGMLVGLAAPAVGGFLIAKHGLGRWIWPFTLAQNGLHLLFAVAAIYAPEIAAAKTMWGPVELRLVIVGAVIVVEVFGAGVGTAIFMTYLMRTCRPEFKAAHFAIVTALMSVSFTLAGVLSGPLADAMGYPVYFAFTFFVTFPGMALTLFIPHVAEPGAPPRLAATASGS